MLAMVINGKHIAPNFESNSLSSNGSVNTNSALQKSPRESSLEFSEELLEFYKSHNSDLSIDTISCYSPWRFVRFNPRYDEEETLKILEDEVENSRNCSIGEDDGEKCHSNKIIQCSKSIGVTSVPWLEPRWGFYALPAKFPLSKSPSFRSGKIYGMDVSSGAAVAVLLTDHYDINSFDDSGSQKVQITIKEEEKTYISDGLDERGDVRILDLCCSPGLKLLQIADFFHEDSMKSTTGARKLNSVKLIGVDICEHRINVCKSIVKKYFVEFETSGRVGMNKKESLENNVNIQLFLQDGTIFGLSGSTSNGKSGNLVFDSRVAVEEMFQRRGKRKRMNKSARAREKKKLREVVNFETKRVAIEAGSAREDNKGAQNIIELFDYVLVDAECSTDGSFKHIKERIKGSLSNKHKEDCHLREENRRLTDPSKLRELVDLQRKLIASGFRLLKDGGTLVYSTCSLSEDQNENVVKWLLESNKDAILQPLSFPSIQNTKYVVEGSLEGTIRFYPNFAQCAEPTNPLLGDGFFVAKVRKRPKFTIERNSI